MKILAINGSYREDGFSNAFLIEAQSYFESCGAVFERVDLAAKPNISFCLNCRSCMQSGGGELGECVIEDGMGEIVEKIEAADAYIFISPTNFFTVTAIFKRFLERLSVYGYWPWESKAPRFRRENCNKSALCVTSAAMPWIISIFFVSSLRILKVAASTVGAKKPRALFFQARNERGNYILSAKEKRTAKQALSKLYALTSV